MRSTSTKRLLSFAARSTRFRHLSTTSVSRVFRKPVALKQRPAITMSTRRVRVYTRTGDKGTSQLYNLERRSKADPIFEALGDTDELNASLGLAIEQCNRSGNELGPKLTSIQSRMLDIGAAIATPLSSQRTKDFRATRVAFDGKKYAQQLEEWIDEMDDSLPPLKCFILPSGGLAASQLHVCRAICRRAERKIVAIGEDDIDSSVWSYVNRLSDFLFVAARFAAKHDKKSETAYVKDEEESSDSGSSPVEPSLEFPAFRPW